LWLCVKTVLLLCFFDDPDLRDLHRLIDGFAHVEEGKGGDADGGEGFHLDPRFSGRLRGGPNLDRFGPDFKLKINFI